MKMMKAFLPILLAGLVSSASAATKQWSEQAVQDWYQAQPWLVGSNFIPVEASNQLEMWQRETFDLKEIDIQLGWASSLGMNTMRVFLHDLAWEQDPKGFLRRLDAFLDIAERHRIRPLLVFFDSVWDPKPVAGRQRAPRPGVHNSRWIQSPALSALADPAEHPRLEAYVKSVVGTFARDRRILGWDLWNEPDNLNPGSYDDPVKKLVYVEALLPQVFRWARAMDPVQPLTSGVWNGDWSTHRALKPIERIQIELSDMISFHSYDPPEVYEKKVRWLKRYGRPVLCTEYMARPLGSTFESILPIALDQRVGSYNWGFAAGKTQTYIPWDSWKKPYPPQGPKVWFHDIFDAFGRPYRTSETDFIRTLIRASVRQARARRVALASD